MNTKKSSSRRGFIICCVATAIVLIILVIVITTLSLTIFKFKQPELKARPIGLENIQFSSFPNATINVTVEMEITIKNPNYGSFKYESSTAYVQYRQTIVAQVPMEQEVVPAHGKINVTVSTDFMAYKLITDPNFWNDVSKGLVSLTSTANLHVKMRLLKMFKLDTKVFTTCDISIYVTSKAVESNCNSRIKL